MKNSEEEGNNRFKGRNQLKSDRMYSIDPIHAQRGTIYFQTIVKFPLYLLK